MTMVNIGFGSMINADKVTAALSPDSAPVKRLISKAKSDKTLIDATFGRKTRTVLVMSSGQIVICAFVAERIFGQAATGLIKFMETDDE